MKTQYGKTGLVAAIGGAILAMGMATSVSAAEVTAKDGWNVSFDGLINAFLISTKDSEIDNSKDMRIASGWDPSKFNGHFTAPKQGGLTVGGNFQFVASVNGDSDGLLSAGAGDTGVTARVLDINIAGDFGTLAIGRSWGIFNSQATISEYGSGNGVGGLCGGTIGGGTCGRIGYGYTWTAFAARVEYDTPSMGGFSARIGLFDPVGGGDTVSLVTDSDGATKIRVGALSAGDVLTQDVTYQTKSPRMEAELTFAQKNWKAWVGLLNQKLTVVDGTGADKIKAIDVGGNFTFGGLGVTAAYTKTEGFFWTKGDFLVFCGDNGDEACEGKQYYVDVSYTAGPTMFGVSHGKGKSDEDNLDMDNTLNMVYVHHNLTKQLVGTLEVSSQVNKADSSGDKSNDIKTWAVGAQYNF